MAAENKKASLFGIVDLRGAAGAYDLSVNGANLNNTTQNVVRVIVDSSRGPYALNLPKVSSFKGFWSPQIMIVDVSPAGPRVVITPDAVDGDTINGQAVDFTLNASKIGTISIGYNNRYAALGFTAAG